MISFLSVLAGEGDSVDARNRAATRLTQQAALQAHYQAPHRAGVPAWARKRRQAPTFSSSSLESLAGPGVASQLTKATRR